MRKAKDPSGRVAVAVCYVCGTMVLGITARPTMGLPRDPDNAALLYYQACVMPPEPLNPRAFDLVVRGADPNDTSRKHLNRRESQDALELLTIATQMPRCDWGLTYSRGLFPSVETLSSFTGLARLLKVQACTLAIDGRHKEAIETCLATRRFAQHIGDDAYLMYAVSCEVDREALLALQYVLGCTPPDEPTLTALKNQLATAPGTPWRPEKALSTFRDMEFQYRLTHNKNLARWGPKGVRLLQDQTADKPAQTPTDAQLLEGARQSFGGFLKSVLGVIESNATCAQKWAELEQIENLWTSRANEGDPIVLLRESVSNTHSYFRLHVDNLALANAVLSAIEVYLVKARTGQLPDVLPDIAPKDPYLGEDFIYEKGKEGFLLRSSPSPFASGKIRHFEFRCEE